MKLSVVCENPMLYGGENDLKKTVKNLGYSLQEPELRDPSDIGLVVAGDD